ncbi:UvrD-helicase domain-containing protein [Alteribacter natronophilus]|uniref:UvrD-helicase domain-containing protein n=1 Tax=Alteribacter natronophilus TaxID=2583810 RepID=UPI00110DD4D4|nr:UvrD-helicase domain-containing protein [Alteribacter natronophilus]TMW73484.1 hypothetical protein FGB90_04070 [Alteribacter natronophilus]
MTELIDQKQRHLIDHDLDRNFLVEAGAGSGKTRSLVTRMTNLIVTGKFHIHEIVAITFTRKAADELKERFQAALEKLAVETGHSVEKDRISNALENFDQCFLGTVHSFCSKILRERPVEAGLDFDFRELDDMEDEALLDQAWEMYLTEVRAKNPEKLKLFEEAAIDVTELRSALKTVKEYEDVTWFTEETPVPDLNKAFDSLLTFINEAWRSMPETKPVKGYDKLQEKLLIAKRRLQYFDLEQSRNRLNLLRLFEAKPGVTLNRWDSKEDAKYLKEQAAVIHEHVKEFMTEWQEYCHSIIVPFLRPALTAYTNLKKELSMLNFQDMLLLTAKMLREQPSTRHYFRRKYKCLLVDEFQDTDPVQAEIMLLLTGELDNQDDWTRQVPKPGSLFVVGDPKQSIYRFRRADIDIYQKVKQMIAKTGGETLDLIMNFRTTSRITSRINPVFEGVMPSGENAYQAAYRPLVSYKEDAEDSENRGIFTLTVPDGKKDEVVAEDAGRVAGIISRRIREGTAVPADFMVLTRYNDGVLEYTKALQELGIPVMTSGESAFDRDEMLRSLAHLYMYLANPSSSFYFTAVLRGPFFGISDSLLLKYRRAGGELHAYSSMPERLDMKERNVLSVCFEKIRRYLKWCRQHAPATVMEMAAEDLGLFTASIKAGKTPRDAVHYYQVIAGVRDEESRGKTLFGDCAKFFYEQVTERVHEELLLPEDHQAVRVMNVHKSKGLEAPYVFLVHPKKITDTAKFVDRHIERTEDDSTGYFTFQKTAGMYQRETIARPPGWDERKKEETAYLSAEEIRLLYVAATRAEEMLIISRTDSEADNKNPWRSLVKEIPGLEEIPVPENEQGRESGVPEPVDIPAYDAFLSELDTWTGKASEESYKIETPSGIETKEESFMLEREEGGGPEWGTFVHELFENQIRYGDMGRSKIRQMLINHRLDELRADEAEGVLNSFIHSDLWKRMEQSDQVLTEVPFMYRETEQTGSIPARYLNGIIDLIFREEGEWVVVDFKTDRLKNESDLKELKTYYQSQLHAYTGAWEKMTGQKVKESFLYFVNHRE